MAEIAVEEKVYGWHFCNADATLGNGDGRAIVAGESLTVDGEASLCNHGLHASERARDALRYASGVVRAQRVWLRGDIQRDDNKMVARERHCIAMLTVDDTLRVLREFALWCAVEALENERRSGREPDERSWEAVWVTRRFLDGEATIEEMQTATHAAYAAADAAAHAAAYAAYAAADAAQNEKLESLLIDVMGLKAVA